MCIYSILFIYTIQISKYIKLSKNFMNLIDIFPHWNLMKSHAPKFLAPFPTFSVRHHPIILLVHFVTYQYHWHIKWMILEMRSVIRLPINIIYSIRYVTSTYTVVMYLPLLFIHYILRFSWYIYKVTLLKSLTTATRYLLGTY